MHELLNWNVFFVREHVGIFKAANNYDILDPQTGQVILECREENLGIFTKMLRFSDYRRMTPFNVVIRTPDGRQVLRVNRGWTLFLAHVKVFDENEQVLGGFKQKFFSIGGSFSVLDAQDQPLCDLKGKWTGWDFRFTKDNVEFAHVSKHWAGLAQELFTSADNYVLSIAPTVPPSHPVRALILAAVMCIDLVLKE